MPYDHVHTYLVNFFIKMLRKQKGVAFIDVEAPYNYFGSRGFIDILCYHDKEKKRLLQIIEIKTHLYNIGGAIRQLRKSHSVLKGCKELGDYPIEGAEFIMNLVLLNTQENFAIFKNNFEIFKSIPDLMVQFINPLAKTNWYFHTVDFHKDQNLENLEKELNKIGFATCEEIKRS